jgi:hypothetical protein
MSEIKVYTPSDPAVFIASAIEKGIGPEQLKQLMDLKERWDANEARKAYTQAMADFKKVPLDIFKDVNVSYQVGGKTISYDHASLDTAAEKINQALSEHGLHSSWKTINENNLITVTCFITHVMGHSESTSLSAGADVTGSKNAIQALGSTVTYLQRYTLFAILGIAAKGQDDDGAGAEPEKKAETISEQQEAGLIVIIKEKADPIKAEQKILKWLNVESLSDIPSKWYDKTIETVSKWK